MMHQITVDADRCRGLHLCHACEAAMPGLVQHCEQHGRLMVSGESLTCHSQKISQLIARCPDRAVMVKRVE